MAAIIGNRNISLGVMGGTLITAACYSGGEVFGCSPYDAATTRYLMATYGDYWQAIHDYGFANPQLVPWINEDNDLIVSLVSVGKVRGLKGDGVAWINTNITQTLGIGVKSIVKLGDTANIQIIIGAAASNRAYLCYIWDGWCIGNSGNFLSSTKHFDKTNFHEIETHILSSGTTMKVDGEVIMTYNATTSTSNKFGLFAGNNRERPAKANAIIGRTTFDDNGVVIKDFAPFIRNGEKGMLDLLTGTFYPNANTSGAFTIELTDTPT